MSMHTTKIPIVKDAPPVLEFCIKPGDVSVVPPEVILNDQHQEKLEKLAKLYYKEDLVDIVGKKYPLVFVGKVPLHGFK